MADDNKTDTIALWSLDRKNRYYLRDKTGQLNGIAASTPVLMLEGAAVAGGGTANIAINRFLHEVKGGGYNFIETTHFNHEQTMAATNTALNSEIATRISADTTLTNSINAEILARTNADTTLTTNLNAEIAARIAADQTISTSVSTETNARIDADSALNTLIVNLTARVATLEAQMANLRGKV
jgi:hypothetical protein